MGSPSKSLLHKAHGRHQLKQSFIQGILMGLLIIFCWVSLKLLIWGRPEQDPTDTAVDGHRKRQLMAFVGVQSGFSRPDAKVRYVYETRREVLRQTWFPSPLSELDGLERRIGIRVRFVIGHTKNAKAESDLKAEELRHGDILRLDIWENYLSLTHKTMSFLLYVSKNFDAKYIVKVDDDIFLRLDRLPAAVSQWIDKRADYVGCMKRGEVFTGEGKKWREPQHAILGTSYYTHVWGCAYVVSGRAARLFSAIPEGTLRFLNNEDTTIGLWMSAMNVTYFDDRRFCTTDCLPHSLIVTDYPRCAGLCNPQTRLVKLHQSPDCHSNPDVIPLRSELIQVNAAHSRMLPRKWTED